MITAVHPRAADRAVPPADNVDDSADLPGCYCVTGQGVPRVETQQVSNHERRYVSPRGFGDGAAILQARGDRFLQQDVFA